MSTPRRSITALQYYGREDLRLEHRVDLMMSAFKSHTAGSAAPTSTNIWEARYSPKPGDQNPWTGEKLPVTLGHEMSGVVIQVGSNVHNIPVGSKVAVSPALDDRHYDMEPCTTCAMGKRNICKRFSSYGFSAPGGGFATEIVVRALNCVVLPDAVSLQVGALVEPLAVAWHCIRTSGFRKGQKVLLLGAGPIGLAILMLLRVWGARCAVVSEVTPSRKLLAKQFGADVVVDPLEGSESSDPVLSAVHQAVGESGVDVAFDATGLQTTLDTAIAATRPGGTIFNVAIHEKPLQVNLNDLGCFEKQLTGGMCYTMEDFTGVLKALESGNLPAHKMITSIVPLEQVIEKGFHELIHSKASHVKILVQPQSRVGEVTANL
ncbi:hypothetical protein ABOM_010236 [Aspergillus bombycis]|uniref:Enoyl reductase (ER) domain-containing protein n=1 Tax=Aspergillus bombycis TaxID=109264 RepID=A0A1F7ZNN6_9EURO|nr:hypothetical protein ABOM_010236 [Aspergillus bombycis]OGM41053.1 hypothetical protein ABOM_010236 [Aspergillus bombycis]